MAHDIDDASRRAVRDALEDLCGETRAAHFKSPDLERLFENGYTDTDALQDATEEGLRHIGLAEVLVDAIIVGREDKGAMCQAPPTLARFWSELKRARLTAGGKLLQLVGGTSFVGEESNGDKLMVRDCYKVLEKRLESDFEQGARGRVIIGTPGIGLSMFGYYLLYRWACGNERVVLVKGNFFQDSAFLLTSEGGAYELDHPQLQQELRNCNTRFLLDAVPTARTGLPRGKLVLVTSPRLDRYSEAIKAERYYDYYMDTWTLEELQECRGLVYDTVRTADDVTEWWIKYGGVPRYVFGSVGVDPEVELREAIGRSSIELIRRAESWWTLEPHARDVLLHLRAEGQPWRARLEMQWSSSWVAEQVAEQAWRGEGQQLVDFIGVSWGLPHGTLRGDLWKGLCHSTISAGGRFRVRDLDAEGCPVSEVELQPCTSRLWFGKLAEVASVRGHTYCRPGMSQRPAVDSLIQPNMVFQIIVADTSPIIGPELQQAVRCMESDVVCLYFVVPESVFETFQKQQLVGQPVSGGADVVRQYALEVRPSSLS